MNTFFRICVFYCIVLLICTLLFGLISITGAFTIDGSSGLQVAGTEEALGELSTLRTPNMNYLLVVIAAGSIGGIAVGWATHSIVPVGVSIFGSVFWASYINTHSILSIGGYVPSELLTIFTVCTGLIFIAAVVGMLTGSG